MRRTRTLLLLALTALAPAVMATASLAEAPAGPQPLSDDELSDLRGGFITTNGFTFGFGVVIRTYVNEQLALKTQMTWTPTGPVTEQVRGDAPGVTDLASALTSLLNNGIDLSGISGTAGGVALVDGDGATALIHNVTSGQLQNLIVNSASNRNLRQDMELNLYLPDAAAMQSASSAQQRVAQMTYDLNTTLIGSLGR